MQAPHSSHSKWSPSVGHNLRRGASITDAESAYAQSFAADSHAAITKDTARCIVENNGRPLLLVDVNLLLAEPALPCPIAENHVLQLALAPFVANGTIQRMIRQQEFQRALARLPNLRRIRVDHHTLRDGQCACDLQLRRLLYFHQAHAAGGLKRETVVIAKCRNLYPGLFRGIDQQCPGSGLQVTSVDLEINWVSHL